MEKMDYDVFISCKSDDYKYAEELYDFLRANHIHAFLASKELRNLGESAYRKAISKALQAATHCIVLASRPEYVESKWVEYEWDVFLNAMLSGYKKDGQLMTIIKGFDVHELPIDFCKYESFTIDNYKSRILTYVQTDASKQRKAEAQQKQQQQAEYEKRMARLRKEIREKEEAYSHHHSTLTALAHEITAKRKELGETEKKCPVCSESVPIGEEFCHKCGWMFIPTFASSGDNGSERLLLAQSNWNALNDKANISETRRKDIERKLLVEMNTNMGLREEIHKLKDRAEALLNEIEKLRSQKDKTEKESQATINDLRHCLSQEETKNTDLRVQINNLNKEHEKVLAQLKETEEIRAIDSKFFCQGGNDYYYGLNGKKRNYEEAFKLYMIAAQADDKYAQLQLGRCYRDGTGVSKNSAEAKRWLKKAAEQGLTSAREEEKKIPLGRIDLSSLTSW